MKSRGGRSAGGFWLALREVRRFTEGQERLPQDPGSKTNLAHPASSLAMRVQFDQVVNKWPKIARALWAADAVGAKRLLHIDSTSWAKPLSANAVRYLSWLFERKGTGHERCVEIQGQPRRQLHIAAGTPEDWLGRNSRRALPISFLQLIAALWAIHVLERPVYEMVR
jgi:hypothetical protein